jgi:DNA mismatch repair ATPase MutL
MSELNNCPKCGARSGWAWDCSVCMARIPCAKCGADVNNHPTKNCARFEKHRKKSIIDAVNEAQARKSSIIQAIDHLAPENTEGE